MPSNRARSFLEDLLGDTHDGVAHLAGLLAVPVPLELVDQGRGVLGGELTDPLLAPDRGRDLGAREAGYDEVRPSTHHVRSRLVRVELDESGAVAEDAQPRPSETRVDRGVPVPAAFRARETVCLSGRAPLGRPRGFERSPARSSRARVRRASVSSSSGSTAALGTSREVSLDQSSACVELTLRLHTLDTGESYIGHTMTELDALAADVVTSGRTLRRAMERGTIRCSRPSPRRVVVPVAERVYVREHWPLLSSLVEALRTQPNVRLAVLYGSIARGEGRPDSDLDVLVRLRNDSYLTRAELRDRMRETSERGVQLVSLEQAEAAPLLLEDVLRDGRVLIDRDRDWPRLKRRKREIAGRARDEDERLERDAWDVEFLVAPSSARR